MVLNPEPHFRPISVRRYLEADSSTPRGRQSTYRVTHPPSVPATGSEEPIPMAAPRPAKRPRTTPTFLEGSNPRDPGRPEPHPIPDDDVVRVTPANSAALPVRSEDSGSDDDHAPPAPLDPTHEEPPAPAPPAPETAPNPPPRIGQLGTNR